MLAIDLDTGNLSKMLFSRQSSEKQGYNLLSRMSLDAERDPESPEGSFTQPVPKSHSIYALALKVLTTLLAVYGTIQLLTTLYTQLFPAVRTSCNCGATLAEASANGCTYDELAASYLPPACRDDALSAQFSRSGPNLDGSWTYYADHNGTIPLTAYDVSQLPLTGGHFFATHEWHLLHCSYYWRKLARSRDLGTVMELRYEGDTHLGHCEGMFLKRDPLQKIVTEAGVSLHADVLVVDRSHGKHLHHEHKEGMKMEIDGNDY